MGKTLTGVVLHADTFDPVRHISQARQACDEPAVTKVPLLDVPRKHIFHESRLLVDLMYALDGLWYVCRGIRQVGSTDVELVRPQAIQAVALFPFEIPVLCWSLVSYGLNTWDCVAGANPRTVECVLCGLGV